MTISIGRYQGKIKEHSIRSTPNGKMYANFVMDINGDLIDCRVWLTDKTIHSGIAQTQLLKCGFDYESRDLDELDNQHLLAGRMVPVSIAPNEYNGQTSLQCNIELDSVTKDQTKKVQDLLRKAKVSAQAPLPMDEDIPF